jgi:hypothetical protein
MLSVVNSSVLLVHWPNGQGHPTLDSECTQLVIISDGHQVGGLQATVNGQAKCHQEMEAKGEHFEKVPMALTWCTTIIHPGESRSFLCMPKE